jgi:hypothetical protein
MTSAADWSRAPTTFARPDASNRCTVPRETPIRSPAAA